ncbi:MAG: site-specific integrase [Armatimonadetes bacterium]|nr:site-specific integrase [Armatimonadota bacterium]
MTAETPIEEIVWLALHSGARLGELLALRWRDIDFVRGTIHIRRTLVEHLRRPPDGDWFAFKEPKSGSGRAVDLDSETLRRLRRLKTVQTEERLALPDVWQDFDLVFPTYCGEPQRPSFVSGRFHTLADSIGLGDVRFHDLRHGHASALLRQMVSPHIVQRRLGHSDPAFTLRVYADVLPGQQREAADGFAEAMRSARDAG